MLHVHLLGGFRVERDRSGVVGLESRKAQELLAYLLMYRNRFHSREGLAPKLWPDSTARQARKYLRQALWQLRSALAQEPTGAGDSCIKVRLDEVQANTGAGIWLDVEAFEAPNLRYLNRPGRDLDESSAQELCCAVGLYSGELLRGCYQDWCLFERERLENVYVGMLDKLIEYCEMRREFESGIAYGEKILLVDMAHERAHRRLIRLYALAGDRTGALRQYERCAAALREHLGVSPSQRTTSLYEQIRADRRNDSPNPTGLPSASETSGSDRPIEFLGHLKQLQSDLSDMAHQLQRDIQAVEMAHRRSP